jgi:hypothetical protein
LPSVEESHCPPCRQLPRHHHHAAPIRQEPPSPSWVDEWCPVEMIKDRKENHMSINPTKERDNWEWIIYTHRLSIKFLPSSKKPLQEAATSSSLSYHRGHAFRKVRLFSIIFHNATERMLLL